MFFIIVYIKDWGLSFIHDGDDTEKIATFETEAEAEQCAMENPWCRQHSWQVFEF